MTAFLRLPNIRARAASQTFWLLAPAVLAACSAGAVERTHPDDEGNNAHDPGLGSRHNSRPSAEGTDPRTCTLALISPATQSIQP